MAQGRALQNWPQLGQLQPPRQPAKAMRDLSWYFSPEKREWTVWAQYEGFGQTHEGLREGCRGGESQLGPESPEPPQLAFLQKPGIPQGMSGGSTDSEASDCPEFWWDGCSPGQQGG